MHPVQNGCVEIIYLVGCEELDALKVFEFSKKYGDKAVPLKRVETRFVTKTSASSNRKSAFHPLAIWMIFANVRRNTDGYHSHEGTHRWACLLEG
jgi:hypothetical protein